MLNFSPERLFLVGVIAFLVLGPDRLPQAARTLGRFVSQLRRMSSGFQDEVRSALAEPTSAVNSAVSQFRVPDVRRSLRDTVVSTFSAPPASPEAAPTDGGEGAAQTGGTGASGGWTAPPRAPDDPSLN